MQNSVDHSPDGKWKFDADVADVFDDMLARSIPQYEIMRSLVTSLGLKFITEGSTVIDLGCSRGGAIADIIGDSRVVANFLGVEVSEAMIAAARERFSGRENVLIASMDIRTDFPIVEDVALVISNLTIQFTPIEYRQSIIKKIYDCLRPGGAFLFVEKVLGASAIINELFVDRYYDLKEQNGYSRESIDRKRLSLEGVLVPVTAEWNEDLLRQAGFTQSCCFWRFLNFAGWVAIK